ncbi:hypothetical protein KQI88_13015 [Alkaliphilus sp. MSJ-5]|uniref:KOW motif-containing protein n=1 Tax=Alkaliphilus flagellatus TaxID=2841507 RepID=A0ABS6G4B3_9FIRM|nr:hypothetical protein [Alkaliphilus flagellatus]MBU5677335.1 hypothetical protein [Alkaliphilus flagellatus]
MIDSLISISITMFVLAFSGYVLMILKEKVYLNNNIVFLDHKNLNQEDLENLDIKHFMLGSTEIMVGDEVKIMLENDNKFVGTVLGANKSNNTIAIITKGRDIKELSIKSIRKLKVISRYGKFFTKF